MKSFSYYKTAFLIAIAIVLIAQAASAYVQVRISIKFIVDANGNRPATGRLNTDAEIIGEFDWGNTILAADNNMSEFRLQRVEFVNLSGVSQWYSASSNETNRDNLRAAAIADPTTYRWRNDAINIYINGG
ncbi:MAG: hypothetical protein JSV44_05700, partial [Candidatus Zixiibacteriota bacterium]